jgi:hypothetical protein
LVGEQKGSEVTGETKSPQRFIRFEGKLDPSYVYVDEYLACEVEDNYNEGETPCYVDSVNGSDANDGLSEELPVKSQSAIDSGCTVVRFRRGSVFNEKLAIPTPFNDVNFGYNVKVYTNYGPRRSRLYRPRFCQYRWKRPAGF